MRSFLLAPAIRSILLPLLLSGGLWSAIDGLNSEQAVAAPTRKDWCGTIWSVENQNTLTWIDPTTGLTKSTPGPTSQITMPGGSMGTAVAAIGIHKQSGTMYAFDRTGTTGTLYKYRFGVDTTWQAVSVTGLIGLTGTQTIPKASNNLNKMTVDGNTLLIAESNGIAVYSIPLNASGGLSGAVSVNTYTYSGDPGSYNHASAVNDPVLYPVGTEFINGGDLTTDEYGDVYNITYNVVVTGYPVVNGVRQQSTQTTKAFFYKQNGSTWAYQGETAATANFAGAAFYKGDLYVKAALQLKKVDLTRSGSIYTGWNNALSNIGTANGVGTGSADLTACGTPDMSVTKIQQVYTDALGTTLATDQTKVKPGAYLKYTITAKDIGDAWARSTKLIDNLPAGTSYVPNSATLNGTNLGYATYPATGFDLNSSGFATGIIPYAPDPDTATLSFLVQVTATSGSIQNTATVTYVDGEGLPSEPPNCATNLNCGQTPVIPIDPPITGGSSSLILVKRITAINGDRDKNPNDNTVLNAFVDDTVSAKQAEDNHVNWIPDYLKGAIDGGKVLPGDDVEYTIYFLSDGNAAVKNLNLCDLIPGNTSFLPNGFGAGQGIQLAIGSTVTALTNVPDQDKGEYLVPNTTPSIPCSSTNTNGAIVVNVVKGTEQLSNSVSPGTPGDSYGFIRFRAKAK